jgi:hypothetical protein
MHAKALHGGRKARKNGSLDRFLVGRMKELQRASDPLGKTWEALAPAKLGDPEDVEVYAKAADVENLNAFMTAFVEEEP